VFEPLKAIDMLNSHTVDYVVVGGWGALHHGATRLTQDLDICPDLTPANLERLARPSACRSSTGGCSPECRSATGPRTQAA
jgi:hypothetical protein